MAEVTVIGGGLAGSEAAWQVAARGIPVRLIEMRPQRMTPAHVSPWLAELVCSNSLGSDLPDRAPGLLKRELRRLGSLVLDAADATAVPGGSALAVDREAFAATITQRIVAQPLIELRREEVTGLDWPDERPVVVATGPLTSPTLADAISALTGAEHLAFYDAMAPIVSAESIDLSVAFRASRYGVDQGAGDYINCPMTQAEYEHFVEALLGAETIPLRDFEREDARFFEACLPIEVLARRGAHTLAYGPLRPTGLVDPRTGRRPYAVIQLRQDNQAATLYNMVGFQTNLKWADQERVLRLIPGLERAEFVRLGQMHRNTFLNSPALLDATLQLRARPQLFFAGQITGTEGYVGSAASGLVAGLNAARLASGGGLAPVALPPTTMVGALCHYVAHAAAESFQPMKANLGLLPPLDRPIRHKQVRNAALLRRAADDLERFVAQWGIAAASIP